MAISKIWMSSLLACYAIATASSVTRHQTIDSSSISGILPTRAVPSRIIVGGATSTTILGTDIVTSSVTIANIQDTKSEATPETVEGRAAAELDPSLQIVFLVLGTLSGLANVVVAVFFGYKQLSSTTNQSNAERNYHVDVDVELGELDVVSDQAHTTTDLATRNSPSVNEDFIRTLETGIIHLSNALKFQWVAIWSFVRHVGQRSPLDLAPPSVLRSLGRLGEPPNADHLHPDTAHV